ncbi:MAG TPA: VWA domain-containing protein [Polyangiaceae bacterium]|nr:VWA domain-containing protein [Polyangiaceae bacterium]
MVHVPPASHRMKLRRVLPLLLLWAALALVYYRYVWIADESAFQFQRGGETFALLSPRALGVALVFPALLVGLWRSLADLPLAQRLLSLTLRVAFLSALAIALANPVRTERTQRVCTVALLDVSDSVSDQALEEARKALAQMVREKPARDELRLITFAARPRRVELDPADPTVIPGVAALRHRDAPSGTAAANTAPATPGTNPAAASTNIQAALELAYGLYLPGYSRRAILLSDGVETEGDLLAEANRAKSFGVRLSAIPFRQPPPPEVSVTGLTLPDKVDVGQTFSVRAQVYASRPSGAELRLFQGEALNGLDGVRQVQLQQGQNEIEFKSVVRVGGDVTYALDLKPQGPDTFRENNNYKTTIEVPGRPLVLYVDGHPEHANYLANALGAQQFDVDLRAPSAFPGTLGEMERFDFVILSDAPREAFRPGTEELIERYVRDLGGGFLFAGGPAGYGLGGWSHSTIERLLPVRMDAERRKEMPGVAMALVIDRSGSMSGLPMEMAKAACIASVSTLKGDDLLEVVAFDAEPVRYVKLQPVRYRSRIQADVQRIQPGGGTELFPALDMAYQDLSVVQARKKHVILLTDGQAPTQGLRELAQAMLAEAITVTTVGLGGDVNQELLRTLADAGGGRFHAVPDPNSLPRIFTRETELVSQQAAVEEWFAVEQVGNADFLKGISIASAPLLHGYVATELKPPPAQILLASDRGEPILARWRSGLGYALAWTSDVKNGWAVEWLRWSNFGRFFGQLVREHMRVKRRKEVDMHVELEGSRVRAVVDAFTPDERFDNQWSSKLTLRTVGSKSDPREAQFRKIAPGRYAADLELPGFGTYTLRADHTRRDEDGALKPLGVSFAHVSNPYPREYARLEPDVERLSRAALATGGELDPTPARLFDPRGEHLLHNREHYPAFVAGAVLLFLLDLLIRRVRLFDRKHLRAQPGRSLHPRAGA